MTRGEFPTFFQSYLKILRVGLCKETVKQSMAGVSQGDCLLPGARLVTWQVLFTFGQRIGNQRTNNVIDMKSTWKQHLKQ